MQNVVVAEGRIMSLSAQRVRLLQDAVLWKVKLDVPAPASPKAAETSPVDTPYSKSVCAVSPHQRTVRCRLYGNRGEL